MSDFKSTSLNMGLCRSCMYWTTCSHGISKCQRNNEYYVNKKSSTSYYEPPQEAYDPNAYFEDDDLAEDYYENCYNERFFDD